MTNFYKKYKIDACLFIIAVFARFFLFSINFDASNGDLVGTIHGDDGYYEISRTLIEGHGFSGDTEPPYRPNTLRTPLYMLFIAGAYVLFNSYWPVIIIQMIIGAFIPVFARRLSLKIVNHEGIGLAVGLATSFEPYLVLFSSIFYTETLFIFLFLAFLLVFIRYLETGKTSHLVFSSAILGLATLTKTTVQYLPILLVPILYWNLRNRLGVSRGFGRILGHCLIFIAVFLVILSPWLYRNYRVFGVAGMSAQPAYNVYVYLAPTLLSLANGTSFTEEMAKFTTMEESGGHAITLLNSAEYKKKAFDVIRSHPWRLVQSASITFITFFTHDGMLTVLQHAGFVPDAYMSKSALSMLVSSPLEFVQTVKGYILSPFVLVLIMRLIWIAVTIFFFAGLYFFIGKNGLSSVSVLIVALFFYFVATSIVGGLGVNARYRMPITPVILALAFSGICEAINAILAKRKNNLAIQKTWRNQ